MQTKLHLWAVTEPHRVFKDLYNLVCDPDFLAVAWDRVRANKGGRTGGVDGVTPRSIAAGARDGAFIGEVRDQLRSRAFRPLPTRERLIPKAGGRTRRLGIPTAADRLVQASLKLVLEPIFEADFKPVSHGYRPKHRAQDAIADIHFFCSKGYEWVFEADIAACFDEISHPALMGQIGRRIGDRRVLALVKAFLKSGIMTEGGRYEYTITGTPQGGILSPLLANIALTDLDRYYHRKWMMGKVDPALANMTRSNHWVRHKEPAYRLVRYADDFVILVHGSREQAEALWKDVPAVLAPTGLRLSETKTGLRHIDAGFDFLGWHIQRRRQRGSKRKYVYTYPSKKALASIVGKVRAITGDPRYATLARLLDHLNRVVRGWCNYFRHGVSARTFNYLYKYMWWRVGRWLMKRHPKLGWRKIQRRYMSGYPAHRPAEDGTLLYMPQAEVITRYRRKGSIPTPWARAAPTAW